MNGKNTITPKILILSVRAFRFRVANCSLYEFEDFLCKYLDADLYAPTSEFDAFRKVYRLARYISGSDKIAEKVSFFPHELSPDQEYDVVLVVADNAWQMHLLNSIRGWRERCRVKAFYVNELWPMSLHNWRLRKEPFANYDYFFSGFLQSIEPLKKVTGKVCNYLPPAVDMDLFNPNPHHPERVVQAAYVGRRDPALHRELMQWASNEQHFYHYDTVRAQQLFIDNHVEHRQMYANLLKRSTFSFALQAKRDTHKETAGIEVMGGRYYELISSGTIVVGWKPSSDQFQKEFGWQDSVISFNPETDDIATTLNQLQNDPERRQQISQRNAAESLNRHDWGHRAVSLLNSMNMPVGIKLANRITALSEQSNLLLGNEQNITKPEDTVTRN